MPIALIEHHLHISHDYKIIIKKFYSNLNKLFPSYFNGQYIEVQLKMIILNEFIGDQRAKDIEYNRY